MAAGKPIIASNIGGLSEILSSDNNSLLIEKNNEMKISKALINLLSKKNSTKRAADNNHNRICKFSIDKMLDKYVTLYQKIIN